MGCDGQSAAAASVLAATSASAVTIFLACMGLVSCEGPVCPGVGGAPSIETRPALRHVCPLMPTWAVRMAAGADEPAQRGNNARMIASQSNASLPGATERRFTIESEGRRVPAVAWLPAQHRGPRPLVLVGHGGSGHKASQLVLDAALPLVRDHGFVVAAIDGPVHGERRAAFDAGAKVRDEFRALWAAGGSVEPMVADWRATLDRLCTLPEVDAGA